VTLVVDASMVVAGLADSGTDGRWAESLLAGDALAAPHLMPVEAANILRRAALAGTSRPTWHRWRTPACSTCAWSFIGHLVSVRVEPTVLMHRTQSAV
jgi:hypothetical protein